MIIKTELIRIEIKLLFLLVFIETCLNVLYSNSDNSIMIDMTTKEECRIFTDKTDIQDLLHKNHTVLTNETFKLTFVDCFKSTFITDNFLNYLIFPGTRWCGFGSIASNFSDLGVHREEDKCCRLHDLCPNYIIPNKCKYNICNRSYFTCSHCECDRKFVRCLEKLNTVTSNAIGILYFNTLNILCFKESPESPKCPIIYDNSKNESNCQVQIKHLRFETSVPIYDILWPFQINQNTAVTDKK